MQPVSRASNFLTYCTFPATVTIAAGQSSATFAITTNEVNYLAHFNFTPTLDGLTLPATFTVTSAYLHVVRALPNGVVLAWDGQANGNFILDNGPNTAVIAVLPNSVHTYTYTFPSGVNPTTPLLFCVHDSNGPYSCYDRVQLAFNPATLGNQAVDSRLDLRYSTNVFLDHCFGTSTYRGGLFAGLATDPARVGRSFALFDLTPGPNDPSAQGVYRSGSVNAYYTGASGISTSQTLAIGCQALASHAFTPATLVWSQAPALTPAQAADVVSLSYNPAAFTPQWCGWALNAAVFNAVQGQGANNADHVLAAAWAAVDETQAGWAYFAKQEWNATYAPTVTRAYSMPTLVSAAVSPSVIRSPVPNPAIPAPGIYNTATAYVQVNGIGGTGTVNVTGSSDNTNVIRFNGFDEAGFPVTWQTVSVRGLGGTFNMKVYSVTQPTVVHLTFRLAGASTQYPTPYDTITIAVTVLPPAMPEGGE